MSSCLISKFEAYTVLSKDEKQLISTLEENKINYKAGEKIRSKGDGFNDIYVVYNGWTYVSNTIDEGVRSIFDIRIDADFIGVSEMSFKNRLYDFNALTDVTVCPFPKKDLNKLFNCSEKIRNIFLLILSREQAILHERLISTGRRTAVEKVAHFIIEVSIRHGMIGGNIKEFFDFPLNQDHIADILGLSRVHVSRAMKILKDNKYVDYNRKKIKILENEKLMNTSRFNPDFLLNPKTQLA